MLDEPVLLENCPKITDVYGMLSILESLGCLVKWENHSLKIDCSHFSYGSMPKEAVSGMRSSVFTLGPLLARCGRAMLEQPGGCVIGDRPIDLHLNALRSMGVCFEDSEEMLCANAGDGLRGAQIELDFPSVGATENIVMAATGARGVTTIVGAAREPEVQALCEFLNACGASISGVGTPVLVIDGGHPLHGTVFSVPGDRIVAGTYLLAGFAAGGAVFLEGAPVQHMEEVLRTAERMGALITVDQEGIYAQIPKRAGLLPFLRTDVYPGFPTDLQSILLAVRCTGEGTTVIRENIFENRFRVVEGLRSMGADVVLTDEHGVRVKGVSRLRGAKVEAYELRGGAALVVAGLGATGETVITGRKFIDRGYENICRDFRELGARIVSG